MIGEKPVKKETMGNAGGRGEKPRKREKKRNGGESLKRERSFFFQCRQIGVPSSVRFMGSQLITSNSELGHRLWIKIYTLGPVTEDIFERQVGLEASKKP